MMYMNILNSTFLYLLQVNIIVTILFIFYKLFFDKDTFFAWRRFTLMGIAIAALILPLIPNISFTTQAAQPIDEFIASFTLPELSTINSPQSTFFSWVMVFELSYILIVSILLLRTLFVLCKLCIILIRSHKTIIQGTSICLLSKDAPPFSFFKWICMPREGLTDEQQNDILIHEQAHIKHLHSIDVVFFQLFTNLNWLNPFVWLMRQIGRAHV